MFSIGHLFLVEGKWWTSAIEIEVGDKLVLSNGEVTDVLDVSAEEVSYPIKTYNLSIDEDHTFFVSSDGILTHNTIKVNSCKTKTSYVKSIADLKNTENGLSLIITDSQAIDKIYNFVPKDVNFTSFSRKPRPGNRWE